MPTDYESRKFDEIRAMAQRIANAEWNERVNLLRAFDAIVTATVAMAVPPDRRETVAA